jgi:antirestriction protein
MDTFNPTIYVGTYAKYNDGSLFGEWIELSDFSSASEFFEYCKELHKDEHDPEFMFQDFENMPRDWYAECSIDEKIWEVLQLEEYQQEQLLIYHAATGYSLSDCLEKYEDMFYFEEDNAWDTMYELYPQVQEIEKMNLEFVNISVDDFKDMYTRVSVLGSTYYVDIH